jgi:hypothetical protein
MSRVDDILQEVARYGVMKKTEGIYYSISIGESEAIARDDAIMQMNLIGRLLKEFYYEMVESDVALQR